MEEGDPDGFKDKEDDYEFEVTGSICNMKNVSTDLSAIVNGYRGDSTELKTLGNNFTWQKIWKWWYKVGFIPMNRNALFDNKVHQQLGFEKAYVGDQRLRCL